jgi:hypothetical protein
MRCETCQGCGGVWGSEKLVGLVIPCPDCGGCGIGHCCDGLQEQPEGDQGDERSGV